MSRLTPEDFDNFQRKNVMKQLEKYPKEKGYVVGCIHDFFFPDNKLTECCKCGIPLYVRAWLLELAQKHNLEVVCQFCVDPQELKGQIIMDFAKIEEELKQ
jgi:hypothetical protein